MRRRLISLWTRTTALQQTVTQYAPLLAQSRQIAQDITALQADLARVGQSLHDLKPWAAEMKTTYQTWPQPTETPGDAEYRRHLLATGQF